MGEVEWIEYLKNILYSYQIISIHINSYERLEKDIEIWYNANV